MVTSRPGLPQIIIKQGTLDNPDAIDGPSFSIFTAEKQDYHHLRLDIPAFEALPPQSGS